MRRFVSGPAIARLTVKPKMTVSDHLRGGVYGETFFCGRVRYADLAEVERAEGRSFTDEQIERAVAGIPDRLLTIVQTKSEIEEAA